MNIENKILKLKEICKYEFWNDWADNWLNQKDRTEKSAWKIFAEYSSMMENFGKYNDEYSFDEIKAEYLKDYLVYTEVSEVMLATLKITTKAESKVFSYIFSHFKNKYK